MLWPSGKILLLTSAAASTFALLCWKISRSVKPRRRNAFPGLLNVGNTCFMNSVLQCLASQSRFVAHLETLMTNSSDKNVVLLAESLIAILKQLSRGSGHEDYFDPSGLLFDLKSRGWEIPYDEHDAQEFLNVILTTIDDETRHCSKHVTGLEPATSGKVRCKFNRNPAVHRCGGNLCEGISDTTSLCCHLQVSAFRGLTAARLKCSACGFLKPTTFERFDCLSLPITTSGIYEQTGVSLERCLQAVLGTEVVSDVSCENCSRLKQNNRDNGLCLLNNEAVETGIFGRLFLAMEALPKLTTNISLTNKSSFGDFGVKRSFYKQTRVGKLPTCLCIHLQRLTWRFGMPLKLMHHVKFPEVLNLKQFCSFRQTNQHSVSCGIKSSKYEYKLTGVIVHIGSWDRNGHFIAYRRFSSVNRNGNNVTRWYLTSDSFVRKVSIEEVLSSPAYMLFYEKSTLNT